MNVAELLRHIAEAAYEEPKRCLYDMPVRVCVYRDVVGSDGILLRREELPGDWYITFAGYTGEFTLNISRGDA